MEQLDRTLSRKHRLNKFIREKVLIFIILLLGSIVMIAPFVWMLSTSFKEQGSVFTYPPEWIPMVPVTVNYDDAEQILYKSMVNGREETVIRLKIFLNDADVMVFRDGVPLDGKIHKVPADGLKPVKKFRLRWENYVEAWLAVPFGRFFINSIIVGLCITFGQVFTSSLAAYAFARLNFKFRDHIFLGYLGTMMIPGTVTMIPVFILLKLMGWIDTYQALILPGMFSAYGTFMLRQFFLSIPRDLEESAFIDGASKFIIYWKIILPLSKPALATLTTFVFMGSWNDFMWPLIVTNSMEMKTLPVGLSSFQGLYTTTWTLLMAATVIVLIPVLVVYIFNQRYFVKGIVLSGLKS